MRLILRTARTSRTISMRRRMSRISIAPRKLFLRRLRAVVRAGRRVVSGVRVAGGVGGVDVVLVPVLLRVAETASLPQLSVRSIRGPRFARPFGLGDLRCPCGETTRCTGWDDTLRSMAASMYIVVEGEDPGFDIFVNGRSLARHEDAL